MSPKTLLELLQNLSKHPDFEDEILNIIAQINGLLNERASKLYVGYQSPCTQYFYTARFKPKKPLTPRTKWIDAEIAVLGIALGQAIYIPPLSTLEITEMGEITADACEVHIKALENAFKNAHKELWHRYQQLKQYLDASEMMILDAYLLMLNDGQIFNEISKKINEGYTATTALKWVIGEYLNSFNTMADHYLCQRGVDIEDFGRLILDKLENRVTYPTEFPDHAILVGEEITLTLMSNIQHRKVVGIISERGTTNSHVAVLARAMNIPFLINPSHELNELIDKKTLFVDAYNGRIRIAPSSELQAKIKTEITAVQKFNEEFYHVHHLAAQTLDGQHIKLYLNLGQNDDINQATLPEAEGIGLYRSEFNFLDKEEFPNEEQQYVIYRQILKAHAPRPVNIRILDIGGDKTLPYFTVEEKNPALGWRGIRFMLDQPLLFNTQIRALLRANQNLGNLRILIPMVSSPDELIFVKKLVKRAIRYLYDHRLITDKEVPPIGAMIEVPSALFQLEEIIDQADFISVGTNDLTQYLLAVDRSNHYVSDRYQMFHPAVIRALNTIAQNVKFANKPLLICGDMANEPLAIALLIGMNIEKFSVNEPQFWRLKWLIRQLHHCRLNELVEKILLEKDANSIQRHLAQEFEFLGLNRLINETGYLTRGHRHSSS